MITSITRFQQGNFDCRLRGATPPFAPSYSYYHSFSTVGIISQIWAQKQPTLLKISSKRRIVIPKSTGSSSSGDTVNDSSSQAKAPFGYTRKDVLLIGVGVTLFGVALKSGLEFVGVDPLQAGNVVQLLIVLGMTVGWISTYMFRVANKDMTYAQQLRDYENKVMEKRLEGLTEAELEVLLEQVEEEKRRVANGERVN